MAVLARRQGLPCREAVQVAAWGRRKAAGVLGGDTRVQLQLLLASYAESESDTTGEESGGTDEEEGGCAHSSAFITRSRCEQPVPSKLVSGDSGAGSGSGSECDGWVFDDDGGYGQDEAYELFQWAVE